MRIYINRMLKICLGMMKKEIEATEDNTNRKKIKYSTHKQENSDLCLGFLISPHWTRNKGSVCLHSALRRQVSLTAVGTLKFSTNRSSQSNVSRKASSCASPHQSSGWKQHPALATPDLIHKNLGVLSYCTRQATAPHSCSTLSWGPL